MADNFNIGAGITLDGEADFKRAVADINRTMTVLGSEMKKVTAQFADNADSIEALTAKHDVLSRKADEQRNKVQTLTQALENARQEYGENSRQVQDWQIRINNAEADLARTESQVRQTASQIENFGREADSAGRSLDEAGERSLKFGDILKANVVGQAMVDGAKSLASAIGEIATQASAAIGTIQAKLGTTKDEAQELTTVAKNVWREGFGEDVTDVTNSLATVRQVLGNIADDDLQTVLEQAYTLNEVFGSEVNESMKSVKTMMDNFGISSTQAFDLITTGFQNGLDYSGEFLDTLNEYSPQFASMGLSADEAMQKLIQGSQNGAFSLDKVADSMKEFNIRIKDGSTTTADGLALIGINSKQMMEQLGNGSLTTGQAMQTVIEKLSSVSDKTKQDAAGVALFGTQWEDLGAKAVLSMGGASTELDNVSGATARAGEAINNNLGAKSEQAVRGIKEAFEPLATSFLDFANNVMPQVKAGLQWLSDNASVVVSGLAGITAAFAAFKLEAAISGVITVATESLKAYRVANEGATVAQWALNAAQEANPVGIIVIAIAGLVAALVTLWNTNEGFRNAVIGAWETIKTAFGTAIEAIKGFFTGLITHITEFPDKVRTIAINMVTQFVGGISVNLSKLIQSGKDLMKNLSSGLSGGFTEILGKVGAWVDTNIAQPIKDKVSEFATIGGNLIKGIWDGITGKAEWLWQKVSGFFDDLTDRIKEFFGIESPSKLFRDEIGVYLAQGVGVGFEREMNSVAKQINGSIPTSLETNATVTATTRMSEAVVNGLAPLFSMNQIPPTIIVQSVLDGHIVAQTVYDPLKDISRQRGVSLAT